MTKKYLLLLIVTFISMNLWAQSPNKLSYQAVVRNNTGQLINNQLIGTQISILQYTTVGMVVYTEYQTATTNANGLVTLEIGNGTVLSGNFSNIDWGDGPYFIKTETDLNGGTSYTITGTTQLLSVPYALHAKTVDSISENDPVYNNSVASGITNSDTTYWNNKLDTEVDGSIINELQIISINNDTIFLSDGGYVKLPAENDPFFTSSVAGGITSADTAAWNSASIGSYTENDPIYTSSIASGITVSDTTSWNNKLDVEVDGSITNEIQVLSIIGNRISLSNGGFVDLPAGFDGNYSSLIGAPTNVSTFTNDAGYLTSFTEVDGSITNEIQALSILGNRISLSNGGFVDLPAGFDGNYSSLIGAPTNVSTFTNDAGYLTSFTEVDGSITNEIQALSITGNRIFLSNGGFVDLPASFDGDFNSLINVPINLDTDYTDDFDGNYSSLIGAPTNVSTFTNDAGYLTSFTEVDGSITNEIQALSITGNRIYLSNGGFVDLPASFDGDYNSLINTPDLTSYDTEGGNDWNHTGNTGTTAGTDFIGTTDVQDLVFKTNNTEYLRLTSGGRLEISNTGNSVFIGENAGENDNLTTNENVAIGHNALRNNVNGNTNIAIGSYSLYSNDGGDENIALGYNSLAFNTTGSSNMAIGPDALAFNSTGSNNTALGFRSLNANSTGYSNVAIGVKSMFSNSAGDNNVAVGDSSLYKNTASKNTAIGGKSMFSNTSGDGNTAVGYQSLTLNTIGDNNTTSGYRSLYVNVTGDDNSAFGYSTLRNNTSSGNTAMGSYSLYSNSDGSSNTAIGFNSMSGSVHGSDNVAIGSFSLSYNNGGNDNIALGTFSLGNNSSGSNNIAIGKSSMSGNVNGSSNVAIGVSTLKNNNNGNFNVAIGDSVLLRNTADGNTAVGSKSMNSNTSGYGNTAIGNSSLMSNSTGYYNTASGDHALHLNTSGYNNTANGLYALYTNTTGNSNTAVGYNSMLFNSSGSNNTALGNYSLAINSTGSTNTAIGNQSLMSNSSGYSNVAVGTSSLQKNSSGNNNVAVGDSALFNNKASSNTAMGSKSLYTNTTGYSNVAIGNNAMYNNSIGKYSIAIGDSSLFNHQGSSLAGANTAIGYRTLINLTSSWGTNNVAIGFQALSSSVNGRSNVAIGSYCLYENSSGLSNTATGFGALASDLSGSYNSAFGCNALFNNETGDYNVAIGTYSDVSFTGQNNSIVIGYNATVTASNRVRIGNTSITRIGGQVSWSNLSDGRIKTNVQENVSGLDFIMKLRPVTYNFDKDKQDELLGKVDSSEYEGKYDIEKTTFTGFIAQEVEEAADQVGFDFSGITKPEHENDFYGLRYAEFVVPLVKSTQEQQQIIEEQKILLEEQKRLNEEQEKSIEELIKRIEALENE